MNMTRTGALFATTLMVALLALLASTLARVEADAVGVMHGPYAYLAWVGLVGMHIVALRLGARALGLPAGRVFLREGAPCARAARAALAGPLAHGLLVVLLTLVVLQGWGDADPVVVVTEVVPGAPADGRVQPGDELLEVGGQPLAHGAPLGELVQASQGEPLTIRVRRAEASVEVEVTPALDEGRYRIGVRTFPTHKPRAVSMPYALLMALATPLAIARETLSEVAEVIRGDQVSELVGPIGIVVVPEDLEPPGWVFFCGWLAHRAVNVGLTLLSFDLVWIFVRVRAPARQTAA